MATLFRANGEVETFPDPGNGRDYSLWELRSAIGDGYIEIVYLHTGELMIIDEEAKLKGLPVNRIATALYRGYGGALTRINPIHYDHICGDALVIKANQIT